MVDYFKNPIRVIEESGPAEKMRIDEKARRGYLALAKPLPKDFFIQPRLHGGEAAVGKNEDR